ncbi:MAG: NUDIX hydrolase N-terminal domain-containing protein [Thermoanaerobaculaceae bacterium]|jgi:ADP-ribose pyrophosphatase YjhB (NUDIX family)|nr:NUDIX hydrolase N-terminal domain-containing protein [Thermoanaerobaculaceae bacterium]
MSNRKPPAGEGEGQGQPLPRWLEWAREIQALCQTGLAYAARGYDRDRYRRLAAIAAEIVAEHSHLAAAAVEENFVAHPGYATPKVDVRAAVVRDGRILLVQERTDQRWAMPGGWADVGETPSQMVVRETWEESGFEVVPRRLVGVFDANRGGRPLELFHAYKLVFLCDIVGGTARTSDETLAVDFFAFDALPPLSEQRTNQRHLDEIRAHLADPLRPAAFD